MKKTTVTLFLLAFSFSSLAESVNTRVVDVLRTTNGKEAMVFIEAQERVIWLKSTDLQNLAALKEAKKNDLNVRIDFEEKTGDFKAAQLLDTVVDEVQPIENELTPSSNYTATVVKSFEEATRLFNTLDKDTNRKSQCYNRAYSWGYELWRQEAIDSKKIFIFFTKRYIETYRYHWWFHVAPMIEVQTFTEGVQEYVLDRTYGKGPQKIQEWTDYFVRNTKPVCPRVNKYSDYRQHQQEHDCFIMVSSQYYRQPNELERLEKEGKQELYWDYKNLEISRKDAFVNWKKYYR